MNDLRALTGRPPDPDDREGDLRIRRAIREWDPDREGAGAVPPSCTCPGAPWSVALTSAALGDMGDVF